MYPRTIFINWSPRWLGWHSFHDFLPNSLTVITDSVSFDFAFYLKIFDNNSDANKISMKRFVTIASPEISESRKDMVKRGFSNIDIITEDGNINLEDMKGTNHHRYVKCFVIFRAPQVIFCDTGYWPF